MEHQDTDLQTQEVEKQEVQSSDGSERTRATRAYVPRVDIYETDNEIKLVADMPGVNEESLDITLEKNVLSIDGYVNSIAPSNYNLAYAEYDEGDYHRRFTLSNEIDQDKIEASMKHGVLHLTLPKAAIAKSRKIAVKAA